MFIFQPFFTGYNFPFPTVKDKCRGVGEEEGGENSERYVK